ncbi:hypothetical protein H663_015805 [Limnohabitans planktonicus II-D5]|uniref:Uncharacterized protein n=1 Tax=Limnohabitans planktonicus II-D5 TaxID=1293045 RepID=A0A2T7UAH8_9BURK|nr:hypothetical protein H663_015805 [Limnohabitans planktonicus II-D5]
MLVSVNKNIVIMSASKCQRAIPQKVKEKVSKATKQHQGWEDLRTNTIRKCVQNERNLPAHD